MAEGHNTTHPAAGVRLPRLVNRQGRPAQPSGQQPAAQQADRRPMTPAQDAFLQKLTKDAPGGARAFMAEFTRRCGGAVTSVQASAEIKRLQADPVKNVAPLATGPNGTATTTAPPGRYAVEALGLVTLVEVTKPTEGKWAGYTFIKHVPAYEGQTPETVRGQEAVLVLNEIQTHPQACSASYGRITGRCGICNRRLSDSQSLSMGIGPDCLIAFS